MTYVRSESKKCGTCQYWSGKREFVKNTNPLIINCEYSSKPCKILSKSSTAASSCRKYQKWCELP